MEPEDAVNLIDGSEMSRNFYEDVGELFRPCTPTLEDGLSRAS